MSVFFDPFRSLTNEPFGQQFGSASSAGGSTGIPGLLSLWNAKTPSLCPVGPQIQTSVAGNQPDADGNMVAWPILHPGRGVMVQPAYSNLLLNSRFEGAVSGSPGTAPTNWTATLVQGSQVFSGASLTISTVAARHLYTQTISALANTTYRFDFLVTCPGNQQLYGLITASTVPAGSTVTYADDGVIVAGTLYPVAGEHTLSVIIAVSATAGSLALRFGMGVLGNQTGTATFSKPQLVASAYQMPYAASGAGQTVSVTSTAGDDDPENGLAFQMDSRMTAALSAGGRFTAVALVSMAASANILTDTNILSVNDSITGGIYISSGGVLKVSDGTNTATVTVAGGWPRGELMLVAWWINAAGTHQQIGYKKEIESAMTWGAAVDYAGSVTPGTHLRLGYNILASEGFLHTQLWNKSVGTDAEMINLAERYTG